jgi:hypothetical protein
MPPLGLEGFGIGYHFYSQKLVTPASFNVWIYVALQGAANFWL